VIQPLVILASSAGSALFVIPPVATAQARSSPAEATRKFRSYLDEDWKRGMQEYPETATSVGFPVENRRWSDDWREGMEARIRHLHESVATLKTDTFQAWNGTNRPAPTE
jgi:hypothetical protein